MFLCPTQVGPGPNYAVKPARCNTIYALRCVKKRRPLYLDDRLHLESDTTARYSERENNIENDIYTALLSRYLPSNRQPPLERYETRGNVQKSGLTSAAALNRTGWPQSPNRHRWAAHNRLGAMSGN